MCMNDQSTRKRYGRRWFFGIATLIVVACWMYWRFDRRVFQAAYDNDVMAIREYIEEGGDVNATCWMYDNKRGGDKSLLAWAVRNRSLGAAVTLIDAGAVVPREINPRHPLSQASQNDDGPMVDLLLTASSASNGWESKDWRNIFEEAMFTRKWMSVSAMLNHLERPIDWHYVTGRIPESPPSISQVMCLRAMIDHGMPVDALFSGGLTWLSVAVEESDVAMVRMLLERGANVSIPDSDGVLPIERVKQTEAGELIRKMIEERSSK